MASLAVRLKEKHCLSELKINNVIIIIIFFFSYACHLP